MNFEEWWNVSGSNAGHKDPKEAARDAWQSAYMQACADMGEHVESRVNAAWQTGYDTGRGVD